jgi:hypothetical protein
VTGYEGLQMLDDIDSLVEVVNEYRLFPETPGLMGRMVQNLVTMAEFSRRIVREQIRDGRGARHISEIAAEVFPEAYEEAASE